jgi:hypothetical protein
LTKVLVSFSSGRNRLICETSEGEMGPYPHGLSRPAQRAPFQAPDLAAGQTPPHSWIAAEDYINSEAGTHWEASRSIMCFDYSMNKSSSSLRLREVTMICLIISSF